MPGVPPAHHRRPHRVLAIAVVLVGLSTACATDEVDQRVRCTPVDEGTSTVRIDPPWAPGVERTYEVVMHTDYGGGLEVGLPQPSWAKLNVENTSDKGWVMAWRAVPPEVALTISQFDGTAPVPTAARYEWGSAIDRPEVANPFEVALWLGDVIDSTRLGLPVAQSESFDANVAHFEAMSSTDLDLLFLAGAEMLHTFEGLEVGLSEVTAVDRPIVNGITAEPLRARAEVEIVELVDAGGCVSLRMTRAPDAVEFDRLMSDAIRSQGADDASAEFRLEQTVSARYDPGSGFIKSLTMTEVVEGGPGLRVTDTVSLVDITSG